MKDLYKFLAGIMTLISAVVLIALFMFSDTIAGFFPHREYPSTINRTENTNGSEYMENDNVTDEMMNSSAGITVVPEEITYNGSTPFIIMNGVTATDTDGSDLTSEVSAVVTDDSLPDRKIIKYQVYDSEGNKWTSERRLILEDYNGPLLEVEDNMTLYSENLEELVSYLSSQDSIVAENGYGESILSNVTYEMSKASCIL